MTHDATVMERPQPRHATDCPVEDWLAFLGHRWCALILWQLSENALRFKDLQSALVGVQPKVLTDRLDDLIARGLIMRSVERGFPISVRYALTPRGRQIVSILDQFEVLARDEGFVAG